MIVLDASAAIELVLNTATGARVAARIGEGGESLHAPHLLDVEVAQTLRRYETAGGLAPRRAREALDDFADLDLERYPHDVLLPRVWQLRRNVTACDAVYLALAEALGARVLTCDARLARAPGGRGLVAVV